MVKRLILLLLLLPIVIADLHEIEPEQFTYEQFLQDPNPADFQRLQEFEKDIYISKMTSFGGDNFPIAQEYFNRGNKISENKDTFNRFMASQGIKVTVKSKAKIKITGNGKVDTAVFTNEDTTIDLNDFKVVYDYEVSDDGKLSIANGGDRYGITGIVSKGEFAELQITDGSIGGIPVKIADLRVEKDKIVGTADAFGDMIFTTNDQEQSGNFEYFVMDNILVIKIKNYFGSNSYEERFGPGNANECVFHSRPDDVTIITNFPTIFIEQGEALDGVAVTYEDGDAVSIIAAKDKGRAMIGGVSHQIEEAKTALDLCYNLKCTEDKDNYFYYGNKEFELKGEGFISVIDKQAFFNFKSAQKLLQGQERLDYIKVLEEELKAQDGEEATKIHPKSYVLINKKRPKIKTKLWVEQMFVGSNKKRTSDYHDLAILKPNSGKITVKSTGKMWRMQVEGKVAMRHGYWNIESDGSRVNVLRAHNPQSENEGVPADFVGSDVIPIFMDFTMNDGSKQVGYHTVDKNGEPDAFKYPFSYTGINPNAPEPTNEDEFNKYFEFNLKLMLGQPLDFHEGRSDEEIKYTNEFVCVDVVACAYQLTTGIDMLDDKARLGKRLGQKWTDARRNTELNPYFKASNKFTTTKHAGNDFIKNHPKLHKTWSKGQKIPQSEITLGGNIVVDPIEYGLGNTQFIMWEKQFVKCTKGICTKTDGNPMYHITPVVKRGSQYFTIQAPGECRDKGVCEVELNEYVNSNRCSSQKDLEKGCYAHFGITQVAKPKFISNRYAQK